MNLPNTIICKRKCIFCLGLSAVIAAIFLCFMLTHSGISFIDSHGKELIDPFNKRNVDLSYDETSFRKLMLDDLSSLHTSLDALWCKTQGVLTSGGFCLTPDNIVDGGNNVADAELCRAVETLVGLGSVADFGAGLGFYGMCLLKMDSTPFQVTTEQKELHLKNYMKAMGNMYNTSKVIYSWDGFDGAGNVETLSGGFIRQVDLGQERLWLGRRWDWVMSVEVGEHIPAAGEQAFLDNLARHACKGLILTWAVEGQGGHHHVNNHNNDYIKERMKERGLENDADAENVVRKALKVSWLKNTFMVFRYPFPEDCLEK